MQAPESDPESITGINITPLVDVVLVLLIIFMATAPLLHRRALNVNLPKAAKSERVATETVRVELQLGGKILLDGAALTVPDMIRELKRLIELQPAAHVAVAADKAVPYGEVVTLLDDIKQAGIKRVGLEVRVR